MLDPRNEWWLHFSDFVPIKTCEKWLCFYLSNAQSPLFRTEHSQNEEFCLQRNLWSLREEQIIFIVNNSFAYFFGILMAKGRIAIQTLKHDDSYAPYIHSMIVTRFC